MVAFTFLRKEVYRIYKNPKAKSLFGFQQQCLRFESSFIPKRVLIITKITKYQRERNENPNFNEDQMKENFLTRCIDYAATVHGHQRHNETQTKLVELLKKLNIEFQIKDKYNVDCECIGWADLIVPVGGDGTFLLTSNLIGNNKKPILGINSNPEYSEGFLMLPEKYTNNLSEIFEKLKSGHFEYLMRNRIRTTVHGDNVWEMPFHLHEKDFHNLSDRFHLVHGRVSKPQGILPKTRQLPWLALNEVFIGESMSARISALQFDDGNNGNQFKSVKCSGICVSTGTGSTSWFRTIKSLSPQSVKQILARLNCEQNYSNDEVEKICFDINSSLQYPADDIRLRYVIRDIINKHIWRMPNGIKSEGFCKKLTIKSQCYNGALFIDGGIAVNFNAGTTAELESFNEDALKSIILSD